MTLNAAEKTILVILTVVLLVSLTAASLAVAKWAFSRSQRVDAGRYITATESAEVSAQPDTALVTFGVVTNNKDARKAASVNAVKTSAVISAVRKAGIRKSDIKTVECSLEPSMDWDKSPPVLVGYTASNSVRVRIRSIRRVADLIDTATTAGANNVRGVRFDIEDKDRLRRKCLAMAMRKAHSKARSVAETLDTELGPVISASEIVDTSSEYGGSPRMFSSILPSASVPTPIEPGEAKVSAQVKVVYSIR